MTDITLLPFGGRSPRLHPSVFIASGSRLIGDIEIGEDSSIWYNCVLRADVASITIGARTNIQDGTTIHVTSGTHQTIIGDDCLVGHMVMLHGCHLHDRAFVGLGSIIMDGCEIESGGMLAAGAMLTPGKRILSGQLWAGRPAKFLRELSPEEIERNFSGAWNYVENARRHMAERAALQG